MEWVLWNLTSKRYVVIQFYPWFKFHFPLFLVMVMYDNESKTEGNKIYTMKDKIEPQHLRKFVLKEVGISFDHSLFFNVSFVRLTELVKSHLSKFPQRDGFSNAMF